ncbi:MAG: prepilin-type N-terminal cleavage/methylation domain-containing protein [Thermodesulfovibrionia bacterium]|nr:prepilin-type N-terminal cleavage/methylation domain-containing protein [Thermodesulfovibrionia bacterium]
MKKQNLKFKICNSPSPHPSPHRGEGWGEGAGFTLLEVLVALAISGIALIVVLQLLSSNLKGISVSEDYVSAVIKAEAKMREILDNSNLSEGSWSEVTPDGYRIDVSIRDSEKERTQNLKVRLLGVDLTIHWTKGTKTRSLTLKTMKVVNKKI